MWVYFSLRLNKAPAHHICQPYCRTPVLGFYHTNTPAVLSQVETIQHRFLHSLGQNGLFGWFLLRKNTYRCFTLPEVGGYKGLNKYSPTVCGLYHPCLFSFASVKTDTHTHTKKRLSHQKVSGLGTGIKFLIANVSEDWVRLVKRGWCNAQCVLWEVASSVTYIRIL